MRGATGALSPDLVQQFTQAASSPDPGLAGPALLIARLGYPWLDPTPYLARLEEMGGVVAERLSVSGPSATNRDAIDTLNTYLFEDQGFTGNATNYDDPRNSFLNQVLERRTGIPITLGLVYIEVARRAGVKLDGVNFPGHFLLRLPFGDSHDSTVLIDPFHRGAVLSRPAAPARRRHDYVRTTIARTGDQAAGPQPDSREPEADLYPHAVVSAGPGDHRVVAGSQPVGLERAPRPRPARLSSQRLHGGAPRPGNLPEIRVTWGR